MTDFFGHVAGAALPVAIGLLILAAAARAALFAPIDDARVHRLAEQYLEPLSTWCLVAAVTYAIGTGGAGTVNVLSVTVTLLLIALAVLVRPSEPAVEEPPAIEPAAPPAPPTPAIERPAPPAGATAGSLWAGGEDAGTRQQISQVTGGTFTETADASSLDEVYQRLGSKIGTMRRRGRLP